MAKIPALIVMHGDAAQGLLAAARSVFGEVENIGALSNSDLSGPALEAEIEKHIEGWPDGGIVFTDFLGGSCHLCGMSVVRHHPGVVLITGLNVTMLLDFLHNRGSYGIGDLAERLQKKGQDGIRIFHGQPA